MLNSRAMHSQALHSPGSEFAVALVASRETSAFAACGVHAESRIPTPVVNGRSQDLGVAGSFNSG